MQSSMHKSEHYRAPLALEALRELANMRDDGEGGFARFIEKRLGCPVHGNPPDCYFGLEHYFSPYDPQNCYEGTQVEKLTFIRDQVRKIWRGGDEAEELANEVLFSEMSFVNPKWSLPRRVYATVHLDWNRRELRFEPIDRFQAGVYELSRRSHLAKVCVRSECLTPYFIARRLVQQYCSQDCAEWAKRETQRQYWGRKGSAKRRDRKASRGKRGKR